MKLSDLIPSGVLYETKKNALCGGGVLRPSIRHLAFAAKTLSDLHDIHCKTYLQEVVELNLFS